MKNCILTLVIVVAASAFGPFAQAGGGGNVRFGISIGGPVYRPYPHYYYDYPPPYYGGPASAPPNYPPANYPPPNTPPPAGVTPQG